MATPILKSAIVQSYQDEDFAVTPIVRSASIQAPIDSDGPSTTPSIRSITIESSVPDTYNKGVDGKQLKLGAVTSDRLSSDAVDFKNSTSLLHLVGNNTVSYINGLAPTYGDAYVVTDSGTITSGSVSANAGDIVEYDGSSWVKIVSGTNSMVPNGTRAIISTQTSLIFPYADSDDKGKIVGFDGDSNVGSELSESYDGSLVLVSPESDSAFSGIIYFFSGSTPTGEWIPIVYERAASVELTSANSPYDIESAIGTVYCDAGSGNITLNLPPVSDNNLKIYEIKKISSANTVTITPDGTDNIDGSSSFELSLDDSSVIIKAKSDGTSNGWFILGGYNLVSVGGDLDAFVSTSPYTASAGTRFYYADTTSTAITFNLPAIGASTRGEIFDIKLDTLGAGNSLTVTPSGTDTIDGNSSLVLSTEKESYTLRCPSSGTDWKLH